jgi:hypothetical protein
MGRRRSGPVPFDQGQQYPLEVEVVVEAGAAQVFLEKFPDGTIPSGADVWHHRPSTFARA